MRAAQTHGSHSPSPIRAIVALIAASLMALVLAAPAFAKAVDGSRFSGTDSGIECDAFVRESTFSGWFTIKDASPATSGQFFYYSSHVKYTDVITNPDTGAFFTVSGNSLFKEVRAQLVEGSTFRYRTIQVGQPFVITDMDGKVVLRDSGLIEVSYVFDSRGDGAPGGVLLEDPILSRVAGPHPGLDFDFCALANQLVG